MKAHVQDYNPAERLPENNTCEICEENPKENPEGKWCTSCKDDYKER